MAWDVAGQHIEREKRAKSLALSPAMNDSLKRTAT